MFGIPEHGHATTLFAYLKYAEPTSLRLRLTKMAECYNMTCAKIIDVNASDFVDENGDLLYTVSQKNAHIFIFLITRSNVNRF